MNIKVLYHTRTGNTKTVAEAIADSVGAAAEAITDETRITDVDLLFIGDGVYGGTIDKATKRCIGTLSPSTVKTVAVFSTFGGHDKANNVMRSLLLEQGIAVQEESFGCRGKAWRILNRGRPNAEDIESARAFAKRVVEGLKGK